MRSLRALQVRFTIFERAVKALPGSYKLWYAYLRERTQLVRGARIDSELVEATNGVFERALVYLHKMPRIWLMWLEFFAPQCRVTLTRQWFDNCLKALPVTQHDRVWPLYIAFIKGCGVAETTVRIYRRYLQFDPTQAEEFIQYLRKIGRDDEAAVQLAALVNDDRFVSLEGKSKHELWADLCTLITRRPEKITSLNVDAIIRGGIRRYTQEVGRLWCALADYYIRLGLFEKARDVYEEAIETVNTVRDFTVAFDAYAQFEENMVSAAMPASEDEVARYSLIFFAHSLCSLYSRIPTRVSNCFKNCIVSCIFYSCILSRVFSIPICPFVSSTHASRVIISRLLLSLLFVHHRVPLSEGDLDDLGTDVDLRLFRLEHLMTRRPFMLNSVMLRQNPHNCNEWAARVKLCPKEDAVQIIKTYSQAVTTVDPQKATGHPHMLWINFAKFYDAEGDLDNARAVFEKATAVNFRQVQQLVSVWLEWAEMEIRNQQLDSALEVMRRATVIPKGRVFYGAEEDTSVAVQERLHKSTKLWSFFVDLEESIGTLESTKAVYEKILELKIATPQIVLNYAALMEENKFFEESFRVFERGVALFQFPNVMPLWVTYLTKFVQRYAGSKMERARDLFEQALEKAPPVEAKPLFLLYAKLEEDFGLARRAMLVYDRATRACVAEDRLELFQVCTSLLLLSQYSRTPRSDSHSHSAHQWSFVSHLKLELHSSFSTPVLFCSATVSSPILALFFLRSTFAARPSRSASRARAKSTKRPSRRCRTPI